MSKFRSAIFYLRSPSYWSHFAQRAIKPFRENLDTASHQARATAWASARAHSLPQLLADIGVTAPTGAVLPTLDQKILRDAQERSKKSGYKMGGPGYIDLIYAVTFLTNARSIVETGVAYGWSSLAFLAAMAQRGAGRLVSVDRPYPGAHNEAFVGIAVPEELKRHWRIIREPDRNGLRRAVATFPHGLDLAHYDSDKSYQGRAFGYSIIWDSLKPNGLLISDDIQDNMAFADFVERKGVTYGITEVQQKYVGVAVKNGAH